MSEPNATCGWCGQRYVCDDIWNDTHRNTCPSTMAELDRFKKQNAEFIIELTKLRALRDEVATLLRNQPRETCDLIDDLAALLEAAR